MNLLFVISFALVFSFVGALQASEQKTRQQSNRPPSIESFTSSLKVIQICAFVPNSAVNGPPVVELVVNATDPDGDSLSYAYSVTEGTISGNGKSVRWELNGLPRGPHEVRVTVTDGKGGKVDAAVTVITADSTACDPPPPPCPVVKVSVRNP